MSQGLDPLQGDCGSSLHVWPLTPQSKSIRSPQPPQRETLVPSHWTPVAPSQCFALQPALWASDQMFMHGFTYSGHPVACAVALRNIQLIESENLPGNAAEQGEYLINCLQELGPHQHVCDVRGEALMMIVEAVG